MTATQLPAVSGTDPTVRELRDRFLAAYGLGHATYTDPRFVLHMGRWQFAMPNPGLLPIHDLHHVATGFGSGILGEAEISAFELRTGWGNPLILLLCLGAVALGSFACPRRIWRAWSRSRGSRGLYRSGLDYEQLLEMKVTELRHHLDLPVEGIASFGWPEPGALEERLKARRSES